MRVWWEQIRTDCTVLNSRRRLYHSCENVPAGVFLRELYSRAVAVDLDGEMQCSMLLKKTCDEKRSILWQFMTSRVYISDEWRTAI